MNQRILPADHPDIGISKSGMAVLLLETGRPEKALELAETAIEILDQAYGGEHWRTAWARSLQGAALAQLERYVEAEPITVASYEALRDNAGARPVHINTALERVVTLYQSWGRPDQARLYAELAGDSEVF